MKKNKLKQKNRNRPLTTEERIRQYHEKDKNYKELLNKIHLERSDNTSVDKTLGMSLKDKFNIKKNYKKVKNKQKPNTQSNRDKRHNKKKRQKRLYQQFTSRGEHMIISFLNDFKIKHEREKEFPDLYNPVTGINLRFDFYIEKKNIVIEFDGEQHYRYCPTFHGDDRIIGEMKLKDQQRRDEIKDIYCVNRGIKMIRIPYTQQSHIRQILTVSLGVNE